MPSLRLATFNIENLFSRPPELGGRPSDRRFGMFVFEDEAEARGMRRAVEAALSDDGRQLTAQALIDAEADFVALQEVESEEALRIFRDEYLHKVLGVRVARDVKAALPGLAAAAETDPARVHLRRELERVRAEAEARHLYRHFRVVEGNDGRGIDVGFLSKLPVAAVTSHAHLTFEEVPGSWSDKVERLLLADWEDRGRDRGLPRPSPADRLFRRDCLEVELEIGDRPFTVFICHFKANPPARELTHALRRAEALAVRHLIRRRFDDPARAAWAICGDLNDFDEVDGSREMRDLFTGRPAASALDLWLQGEPPFGVDVCRWISDPTDRWTSWFPRDDVYAQLDHIVVSPAVAAANAGKEPRIIRAGLPYRAERHEGPRYPRVGWDRPKASDHCPLVVELEVP